MSSKTLVTIVAGTITFCGALVILLYVLTVGASLIPLQSVRFILTCLLPYSLIQGWRPARWITVVLIGLAGVHFLVTGIITVTHSADTPYLVLIVGSLYIACAASLLTPKAARHFKVA